MRLMTSERHGFVSAGSYFINYCKVGLVGVADIRLDTTVGRWSPVLFGPW